MEVYKQTNHLQTPRLQRALSINKTWHRHHVCIEGGYLQYVACVLVDLPWWGARSIESPPAWFGLFAGGGISPSPVSGRNLLKLNQTFTILTFLLSLATLQRPITIHNSTVDRVGIILAVVKNWAAPGRPPLSHRSLTLGLRSSGKIDESAPPIIINRSALHPASQCLRPKTSENLQEKSGDGIEEGGYWWLVRSVIAMGHNCSTAALGCTSNKLTDVTYYQPTTTCQFYCFRWQGGRALISL